jgi:hypothetical protein
VGHAIEHSLHWNEDGLFILLCRATGEQSNDEAEHEGVETRSHWNSPEDQKVIRMTDHRGNSRFLVESGNDLRTTPWMACVPKWFVAGPLNTNVTFAVGTSFPPVTQICREDESGVVLKVALLPFPVIKRTGPLI